MHFICVNRIKYENGKLSQSEISRCSHLEFNRGVLVWRWRVGGRWEIFHQLSYLPSKQMYHFGRNCKLQRRWEMWTMSLAETTESRKCAISLSTTTEMRALTWPYCVERTLAEQRAAVRLKLSTSSAQSSTEKQSPARGRQNRSFLCPTFSKQAWPCWSTKDLISVIVYYAGRSFTIFCHSPSHYVL